MPYSIGYVPYQYLTNNRAHGAYMQERTSKLTSGNRVAGFYTKAISQGIIKQDDVVFDYGCGRYFGTLSDYSQKHGFVVLGYDKYNRPYYSNHGSLVLINHCHMVACNNVLNVLDDNSLKRVCSSLASIGHLYSIPVHVTVYEGNRTGKGKAIGDDSYQRNDHINTYIQALKKHFPNVSVKNKIITCLW